MKSLKKQELIDVINESIDFSLNSINDVRAHILKAEKIKKLFSSNKETPNVLNNLINILEYLMLLNILSLDVSSAAKGFLISENYYEKRFSLRQIKIIIYEGYKQIFNFIHLNEQGQKVTRNRNKSFWYKEIGKIVNENLPSMKDDYINISNRLDNFYASESKTLLETRNLLVHYDKKASKVYDLIINIKVNDVFIEMSDFIKIKTLMVSFVSKMVKSLNEKIKHENSIIKNNLSNKVSIIENKLNQSKNEKSNDFKRLQELINKYRDFFDKF